VEQVIAVAMKNADNATKVVREALRVVPATRSCKCGSALQHAILTDKKVIPAATRERLSLILNKYLDQKAGA
jgi:5'-methylthioadenosine phosphorylase